MPAIEKYQVLSAFDHTNLEEQVEKAIERGWQPHGGVAISFIPSTISSRDPSTRKRDVESSKTMFCQAMTWDLPGHEHTNANL